MRLSLLMTTLMILLVIKWCNLGKSILILQWNIFIRIKSYCKVCYTYNRRLNRVTLSSNPEIKVTDKLHELVKSYRRLKELTKEEVSKQKGINIRKAGFSFFLPAGVAVVGNHLVSKILCKKQEKHKENNLER